MRRANKAIFGLSSTLLVATVLVGSMPAVSTAQTEGLVDRLQAATGKVANEKHLLRYKFNANEKLYYEVVSQMAVETTVNANTQKMKSRSKSLKKWEFTDVDAEGNTTFSHTVDFADMWSETDGRKKIHYDSRSDDEVPPDYVQMAETIGKPISIVRANVKGQIIDRKDTIKQLDRGTGGLLLPLPDGPVALAAEWAVPSSVTVKMTDGRQKQIKTRIRYRLEKVESGVATISVVTQVLSPVADARVKSQLLQKLSKGEIKFDVDAGRIISKILDWDETVVGFNGPASSMSFLSRMTERLVPAAEVASLKKPGEHK